MKQILSSALFLLVLFCVSVFIFEPSHLYFLLPWLDIPMHVLGGFAVASFVIAVAVHGKQRFSLTQVLILYLCVAVVWELYEFVKDVVFNNVAWNGWSDTLSDVVNGALGSVAAYFLFKK